MARAGVDIAREREKSLAFRPFLELPEMEARPPWGLDPGSALGFSPAPAAFRAFVVAVPSRWFGGSGKKTIGRAEALRTHDFLMRDLRLTQWGVGGRRHIVWGECRSAPFTGRSLPRDKPGVSAPHTTH